MGILYGMVARGQVVLAEFSATQSNASVVAKQILGKINVGDDNNKDSNVSFSHDRYVFHVKTTDGLTLLCMADDAFGRMIPFAFLEDIHKKIVKTYGRAILSSPAYAMNEEFSRILSQQMDYYSNDPNADRLNRLKGEMTQASENCDGGQH
ncbi:vesicle-associated membrane protein 7 [Vigna unguiculata]|uniref:Vesicle-associated membrane protein 7 n=1 Tax=Vigna unguiculata TaxID=3917 RepID=A0A4D6KRD4_VIGUN|nr:vesicle-associated membrane protein 7 [Vigna unguiculata]